MLPEDAITSVASAMRTLAQTRYAYSLFRTNRKMDSTAPPNSTNDAGMVSSSETTRGNVNADPPSAA